MNRKNEHQHYVSKVLLGRFKIPGNPLQCFDIATGKWKRRSPEKVFAVRGWNQLLISGQIDNTLEAAFSKVETLLPETLNSLEKAANKPLTELPQAIYQNMCLYCTFLLLTSPFAKAAAVANFLSRINSELETGQIDLLRELAFSQETIDAFRTAHARGGRAIIDSENSLQLVYRIQFRQSYLQDYRQFLHWAEWTIWQSPIELPVSDMALVPLHRKDHKAVYYMLPIGPKLLLQAKMDEGPHTTSSQPNIRGNTLTADETQFWFDTICLSAVTELVSSRIIPDVSIIRSRARASGTTFTKIVSPELMVSAGLSDFTTDFGLRIVPELEYFKYIFSSIKPTPSLDSEAESSI